MPVMVPLQSVAVHRNKATVRPEIGKPFNFTQEEIDQALAADPTIMRQPRSERVSEVTSATAAPARRAAPMPGSVDMPDEDDDGDDDEIEDDDDEVVDAAPPVKAAARPAGRKNAARRADRL